MTTRSPVRIAPPAQAPVSLAEAKAHLRQDFDDDDALILALVEAATAHLDGWSGILGRCLVAQDWRIQLDAWPDDRLIRLPFPDVSAASVTFLDADGVSRSFAGTSYSGPLNADIGGVLMIYDDVALPALQARPDAITVNLTAGYGATGAEVPAPIRAALLIMVADLYQHRASTQPGLVSTVRHSAAVDALLAPYRRVWL